MNQFDPVSNPYTTLPLLYTACPIQDTNLGWLGQYGKRFHYPTVLEFFKYLALAGLPNLQEAGRVMYFGDDSFSGRWYICLEEKFAYETVPVLRFEIGGQSKLFKSPFWTDGPNAIVQHTLDWLQEAWTWFLANIPAGSLPFPTWEAFLGVPPAVYDGPPGDIGENEITSHSSNSSSSSQSSDSSPMSDSSSSQSSHSSSSSSSSL